MRRLITGMALLALLVSLGPSGSAGRASAAARFVDVPAASPHAAAITSLAEVGVTAGCADDRYCPRQSVTRDQMASFLARALGLDASVLSPGFADVAPGSVHAGAIGALARAGITTGCGEDRYCPRQRVTRDQMASFLARAFGLPEGGGTRFADVAPGSAHHAAIDALATAGVTAGCADGRFCPRQAVTRDQMASFLARSLGLVGPPPTSGPSPSTGPAPGDLLLAFVHEPFRSCPGPCAESTSIWSIHADGSNATPVTQPAGHFDRHPRWAPDGRALSFVRTPRGRTIGEVYVMEVSGGGFSEARQVSAAGSAHGGRGCQATMMVPVWSPDARRLAFTCAAGTEPGGASSVVVVGADGSGQFAVPTGAAAADAWPTWSADSRRLAFARTERSLPFGAPQRVGVYTADVAGPGATGVRALVRSTEAADHPRWSPAGDRILYVSVDQRTLRPSLRTVPADGGAPTTVYTAPADQLVQLYAPVWSPQGTHVAFPVGDGLTRSVVHVVAAGGGPAKAVSPQDALAFAPAWGPSGHLAFDVVRPSVAGGGGHTIATAAADATGYRPFSGGDAYAFDAVWRPYQ